MDRAEMQRALDDVFDQALVFHGFTDYMRDYELITYSVADPKTGIARSFDRFVFRYCVQATVTSTVTPDTWRVSLDERLIDHETGKDLDGYVWGVKWQVLYPGGRLSEKSDGADQWSLTVGIPFHEVVVEANGHKIILVFSDLEVTRFPTEVRPNPADRPLPRNPCAPSAADTATKRAVDRSRQST